MTEVYYKPNEVQSFKRQHIIWLIPYLPLLRGGSYPRDPKETGYTQAPGKRQIKAKAPFIIASEIAAELDARLQMCNSDGLFLEMVYSQPDDRYFVMQHIAVALGVDINTVERDIHRALNYCCGYKRKQKSYREFRNHKGGKE